MEIKGKNHFHRTRRNKLRFIFNNKPSMEYIGAYIDPDSDGNHPVKISGKK
jgi:hypothetical protein